MTTLESVKTVDPDQKLIKSRPKSEVSFPYFDLDKSIEVAQKMHEDAGGRCTREQLASVLGYSGTKNGGFLTRISAAKMFGLVDEAGDSIVLSERAKRIISPVREQDSGRAKLDAFMAVELYRRVYEDFKGQALPQEAGLKNLFTNTYKVVPNQVAPALRNLLDSAESAGLFRISGTRSKMVEPLFNESQEPLAVKPKNENGNQSNTSNQVGNEFTGNGEPPNNNGRLRFEVPIPGKPSAVVIVPDDLDGDDWEMLSAMMTTYINRWKKFKKPTSTQEEIND